LIATIVPTAKQLGTLYQNRYIDILSCPSGNNGKTTFIKRLVYKYGKQVLFIPVSDNPTQVLSAFVNFVEDNGFIGPDIVIIDVPRAIDYGQRDPVTIIKLHNIAEIIRSGLVTTSMYGKYKMVMVKNPRILLCTNYDYDEDPKSILWCPPNRFVVHKLEKFGEHFIIPTLIHSLPVNS